MAASASSTTSPFEHHTSYLTVLPNELWTYEVSLFLNAADTLALSEALGDLWIPTPYTIQIVDPFDTTNKYVKKKGQFSNLFEKYIREPVRYERRLIAMITRYPLPHCNRINFLVSKNMKKFTWKLFKAFCTYVNDERPTHRLKRRVMYSVPMSYLVMPRENEDWLTLENVKHLSETYGSKCNIKRSWYRNAMVHPFHDTLICKIRSDTLDFDILTYLMTQDWFEPNKFRRRFWKNFDTVTLELASIMEKPSDGPDEEGWTVIKQKRR